LLPQQFILDDQNGIHDPVGMVGNRLEVCLHLSTCSGSASQSVVTCANRAGLEVVDTVFEGIAAAEAVLSADERELGVCVVDIGASSTELVVFFEGSVAHTAVLPIGGDHFTNDLAVGLHVSVEEAEQLKRMYGNCVVTSIPQMNEIEIGSDLAVGGHGADGAAAVSRGDPGASGAGVADDAARQSSHRWRAGGDGRGLRVYGRRIAPGGIPG
jgi:cell division protein FtsA